MTPADYKQLGTRMQVILTHRASACMLQKSRVSRVAMGSAIIETVGERRRFRERDDAIGQVMMDVFPTDDATGEDDCPVTLKAPSGLENSRGTGSRAVTRNWTL